jgi:hypothetical protein
MVHQRQVTLISGLRSRRLMRVRRRLRTVTPLACCPACFAAVATPDLRGQGGSVVAATGVAVTQHRNKSWISSLGVGPNLGSMSDLILAEIAYLSKFLVSY